MEQAAKQPILVVDDEPLVRETLEFGLQNEYSVRLAATGREAIEAAKNESFPVVLLDLRMHDLDGISTLRELRKIDTQQKVIILTAHQSMESAIEAVNLGAFNYLTKPCDLLYLRELISNAHRLYFEEKQRTERFRESMMSMHDEVFSVLCHEFNTPLNGMIGFSGFLADELKSPEHREMATYIEKSGKELHSIFVEMMDYLSSNRPQNPAVDRRFSFRDLEEWISSSEFPTRCSVFFSGSEDQAAEVCTGPLKILKMILSKIAQSGKPNLEGISLVAWFSSDEDEKVLHLQIQGKGLDPLLETAGSTETIFSPYAASSLNLTGKVRGLGLHMATCRNLAEYSGIDLSCDTDSTGRLRIHLNIPVNRPYSPDDEI
ncbi:response regulator [Puniceicoccus vermicola]|uniref:histidine kinase n=1 Tax=Puniceicoccus vermicola TaxID=388746 RepID=A0A7X1AWT2_9BACT|nr:response regulator [Puniceicoccus vermicola]MBC2601362.1 response regulator [Puniceicoccus vermicola]